jgi:hypothetical protein
MPAQVAQFVSTISGCRTRNVVEAQQARWRNGLTVAMASSALACSLEEEVSTAQCHRGGSRPVGLDDARASLIMTISAR